MTQEQKIIRAKVGLLELAKQLGNVCQACKVMGYSTRQLLSLQGALREGRRDRPAGDLRRKPILKNRVDPEIEQAVVALAIEQPAFGQAAVANELKKRGLSVSPAGVRSVWLRHA